MLAYNLDIFNVLNNYLINKYHLCFYVELFNFYVVKSVIFDQILRDTVLNFDKYRK